MNHIIFLCVSRVRFICQIYTKIHKHKMMMLKSSFTQPDNIQFFSIILSKKDERKALLPLVHHNQMTNNCLHFWNIISIQVRSDVIMILKYVSYNGSESLRLFFRILTGLSLILGFKDLQTVFVGVASVLKMACKTIILLCSKLFQTFIRPETPEVHET